MPKQTNCNFGATVDAAAEPELFDRNQLGELWDSTIRVNGLTPCCSSLDDVGTSTSFLLAVVGEHETLGVHSPFRQRIDDRSLEK